MKRIQSPSTLIGLLSLLALVPATAHAVPEDVARIFDKSQRQLQSPPSSLRSSETGSDARYFSGVKRLQRRVGSTEEETSAPAATAATEEVEVTAPQSPSPESKVVIIREGGGRQERRQTGRDRAVHHGVSSRPGPTIGRPAPIIRVRPELTLK